MDYIEVGKIIKPHGYRGELTIRFGDEFQEIPELTETLFIFQDGAHIPLFIDEYSSKNSGHFKVKVEDCNSEAEAKNLSGHEVFIPQDLYEELYDEEEVDLSGFLVKDPEDQTLGEVVSVEDYNGNVLLRIKTDDEDEQLLPFHEDFIIEFDPEAKIMVLELPEGLMNMNSL